MELRKSTIWHETILLLIYLFASPIFFGVLYPEEISGDRGIIYLAILFISLLTLIFSLIIIIPLKLMAKMQEIELFYGLIPLTSSFLLFISVLPANKGILNTYCVSNSILLIGLYLISILLKLKK